MNYLKDETKYFIQTPGFYWRFINRYIPSLELLDKTTPNMDQCDFQLRSYIAYPIIYSFTKPNLFKDEQKTEFFDKYFEENYRKIGESMIAYYKSLIEQIEGQMKLLDDMIKDV